MRKLAEDNYAVNRAYDYFVENVNKEDIIEITGRLHNSWENANLNGYINEKYDSFNEWLIDYGKSIADDIISLLKNNDDKFSALLSNIKFTEKEEFEEKIYQYLLNINEEIENGINESN